MKYWHARIVYTSNEGSYGTFVPTGMTDKAAAVDYMKTYPTTSAFKIVEWLLL